MLGPGALLALGLNAGGRYTGDLDVHLGSRRPAHADTSLAGTWHLRMNITQSATNDTWPPGDSVDGTLSLHVSRQQGRDSLEIDGTARVDLRGRLAVQPPSNLVTTRLLGDRLQLDLGRCVRSARGEVCYADGGTLSFTGGRRSRDSITGVWEQEFYCCGARGTFVMTRAR
jgi:hypothetical protein